MRGPRTLGPSHSGHCPVAIPQCTHSTRREGRGAAGTSPWAGEGVALLGSACRRKRCSSLQGPMVRDEGFSLISGAFSANAAAPMHMSEWNIRITVRISEQRLQRAVQSPTCTAPERQNPHSPQQGLRRLSTSL